MSSTAGRIMRWTGKALLWLVVIFLVLAVAGAIYQVIATQRDERAYPPPGKLVDVGGHRLQINCMGRGNPTVILESGLGLTSADWGNVQPEVAMTTRVCAYDRAGSGWSEPGPEPRDARQISGELHALLEGADIEGPYVLVGHSFGGLYARTYAARYPDGVAGVVLVDSSHPEQFSRQPDGQAMYEQARRLYAAVALLTRLGVVRLFDLNSANPGLPPRQRAWAEAIGSSTRQARATAEEFRSTPETFAQVRSTESLGDKPLAVVSAGEQSPDWLELQDELAALSSESSHRVVDGATHESLLYEGRDAQVTSMAVLAVVEAVRKDQPLATRLTDEAAAKQAQLQLDNDDMDQEDEDDR